MSNRVVVIPTYNEKENIEKMIRKVFSLEEYFEVLVVDDNSPDGTGDIVRNLQKEFSGLHLLSRAGKEGLGKAYLAAFQWALDHNYEFIFEMDCDFSHPPTDIQKGISLLKDADMVMGSRYPNGEIVGWPAKRRVFSFFANQLARTLIDWKIEDYTNGYRFYNRKAAEFICAQPQNYKGYIYLSETISYLLRAGFRLKSFPILFVNRQRGESNTNIKEITHALKGVFQIGWDHRTKKF